MFVSSGELFVQIFEMLMMAHRGVEDETLEMPKRKELKSPLSRNRLAFTDRPKDTFNKILSAVI